MHPVAAIEQISHLYSTYGHCNYDEVVSQVQHAVQSGRLAKDEGYHDEVILGAFLHDIGHLMLEEVPESQRDDAIYRHQMVGANYLRELGFSNTVALIVGNHVASKRYLTAINPDYATTLSPASINSLKFQGGPMNAEEVAAFAADPNKDLYVAMRHWDDLAKNPDDTDTDMQPYLQIALEHLKGQAEISSNS